MPDYMKSISAVVGVMFACLGCSVEQQQPPEAPDIDVAVDPGTWPEYDVRWADVDVGTEERTITVPTIRIEQANREVTVPYIRVNPPGARDVEERTVALEVDVPHTGYRLEIVQVIAADDDLWVIGELRAPEGQGDGVQDRVADQIVVEAPADLDVRRVVIGNIDAGSTSGGVRVVNSRAALTEIVPQQGRILYSQGNQTG